MSEHPGGSTAPSIAELTGAWRTGDDMTDWVWAGAHLEEATFVDCNLSRIRATAGTWRHTRLHRSSLRGADLAGLATSDCSLAEVSMDHARFTGSTWLRGRWRDIEARDLQAEGLSAVDGSWSNVILHQADLREADFSGSAWKGVHLIECDLRAARFADLRGNDVRFSGCLLDGISGVDSLRGAMLDSTSAMSALGSMARHLGLRITEGEQ